MSSTQTISVLRTPEASLGNGNSIQLDRIPPSNSGDHNLATGHPEGDSSPVPRNHAEDHWDSGEGWLVVAAGCALFFVYLGLIYSYGIVQLHLVEARLANVSTLSFVGSVAAALAPLTGTVVARVIRKIGYRSTTLTGSFILGLGEFTAGWSTKSVPAMFVTQGVLFGVGAALLFLVRKMDSTFRSTDTNFPTARSHDPVLVVQEEEGFGDWGRLLRRWRGDRFDRARLREAYRCIGTGDSSEDPRSIGMDDLPAGVMVPQGTSWPWRCFIPRSMVWLFLAFVHFDSIIHNIAD